jgi:hypothetical protein
MTSQATKSIGPSSPTILITADDASRTAQAPLGVLVTSLGSNTQTVYLGGSGVSSSTGVPLLAGGSIGLELWSSDTLYAIAASGLQELRILYGPFIRAVSTPGGGTMTAAEILAALLTVDGAGSGLDADLLDGLNSTAFALITNTDSNAGRRIFVGTITPSSPSPVTGDVWVNI